MKDHDSAGPGSDRAAADLADRDSVSDSWGRAAAYDAYADGLHTYALGGLRNHEAAASAVYCAFIAADHHVAHLGDADMLRPWLYAITRHYCRQGKLPRLGLTPASGGSSWELGESGEKDRVMAGLERSLLAAELASLDWPDTAGMQTAHREVLELSVRHGLESRAVGLILARPAEESFELLAQAWTELERSLATIALLRTTREHCAQLASLAAEWNGRLTARTREPLVAHVDTCSHCQYYLHTVIGSPQAPTILPHVAAPGALRPRSSATSSTPRRARPAVKARSPGRLAAFDPWGFPDVGEGGLRAGGESGGGPGEAGPGVAGSGATGSGVAEDVAGGGGGSAPAWRQVTDRPREAGRRGTGPAGRDAAVSPEAIAAALDGPPSRSARHTTEGKASSRSDRRARSAVAVAAAASPGRRPGWARFGRGRPVGRSGGGRLGRLGSAGLGDAGSASPVARSARAFRRGRRGLADGVTTSVGSVREAVPDAGPAPEQTNRHRKSGIRTLGGSVMLLQRGRGGPHGVRPPGVVRAEPHHAVRRPRGRRLRAGS